MLIAIHQDATSSDAYLRGWAESLSKHGVIVQWVDLLAQDALDQVQGCDGVMWHWGSSSNDQKLYRILKVIELNLGIPVFPNHVSSWHRRDKLAQYYLLQSAGVPMPKTWVFWEKQAARDWAFTTNYPKVFKLSCSGGTKDVVLVSSPEEACLLIDRMVRSRSGRPSFGIRRVRDLPVGGRRSIPCARWIDSSRNERTESFDWPWWRGCAPTA